MIDDCPASPGVSVDWLALLDPDPVRAEACYIELRRQLRRFLEWDCREADDAAQEVLVRGFRRISGGADTMEHGARAYFFGIARNIIREGWKPKYRREQQLDPDGWERHVPPTRDVAQTEARLELDQYLGQLEPADADLIVRYTVDGPESLVRELGITREALRVRVFRVRERLRAIRDGDRPVAAHSDAGRAKRSSHSRHGQRETERKGEP